jgi:hypothetical protein
MQLPKVYEKSNKILHENIEWLISSDIRIKNGDNKGALYGWKNLTPPYFPFIYSEITGYAITCFSWIASEFGNPVALEAAKEASEWIRKNMHSNLLIARPPVSRDEPNELSDSYYSFDNGMIIVGLLSLQRITKDNSILKLAEKMTQALIERFLVGEKLIPRLDRFHKPMKKESVEGTVKWSTVSGPYHSKLTLAFLALSKLTNNRHYAEISDLICNYAIKLQKPSGQFITNPGSDIVYLHPHLYACEGLIYSGLTQANESHYLAGIKGIIWAMQQMDMKSDEGLRRDTSRSVEQSDCTAQLLRLLILCQSRLKTSISPTEIDDIIERLHSRLMDFCVCVSNDIGGMRYQHNLNTVCSWCTMFSMQALRLWNKRNAQDITWIEYFV